MKYTIKTLKNIRVSGVYMQETADKIIEAAANLFMRYGIKSVTMDDISRELSMSKKTIYQFFRDKNEIVSTIAKDHLEREKTKFEAVKNDSENAIEELYGYSSCMRELFTQINPVVLYDLKKYYSDAWQIYLDYKKDVFSKSMIDTIKKGIEQGYFRKDINPEVMAALRLEEIQWTFDENIFPSDKYEFINVQIQLFDHFIYGLVTEKGYREVNKYFKTKNSK